jgi:acetyltransferase-like isoleucine patch superfamily enzyme
MIDRAAFKNVLAEVTGMKENQFHPFVWIIGEPQIGDAVHIGGFTEVNARNAKIVIGAHCDIASFVSINCADSHRRCVGLATQIDRRDIFIEDHVFIGSHSVIKGGSRIGHHSVVAAGTIVGPGEIPPYSLVAGNPMMVKAGYYRNQITANL